MNAMKTLSRPALLLLLLLVPLAGCRVNEATGRNQLTLLSWEDEVRLGSEATPQFLEQGGGQLPDAVVVQYVSELGQRLAAESEMPDIDWRFHVLDSQVINAFALPGGSVFVSRGLMEKMTNEAQLAGVLGHEIGHVTARHGNERMSQAMVAQGVILAIGVGAAVSDEEWMQVLGAGTAVGGQLFLLRYSRENELEADALGVRYMTRVGYNPVGQVQVMEILRAAGGGAGGPEWLATHPAPDTRINDLEQLIVNDYPAYDQPGVYVFREAEFKQNVLQPLSELPPAQHGASAFIGPGEFEQITGLRWQDATHRGCACHPVTD